MADHGDGRPVHDEVRHESRDLRYRWVLAIAIAAVLLGSLHFVLVRLYFDARERRLAPGRASPFPLASRPSEELPPEPRLEPLESGSGVTSPNIEVRTRAKERILNSYGPTEEEGFVHIPIERAMRLAAERLPVRDGEAGPQHRAGGLVDAGESNSGRMFRVKRKETP